MTTDSRPLSYPKFRNRNRCSWVSPVGFLHPDWLPKLKRSSLARFMALASTPKMWLPSNPLLWLHYLVSFGYPRAFRKPTGICRNSIGIPIAFRYPREASTVSTRLPIAVRHPSEFLLNSEAYLVSSTVS